MAIRLDRGDYAKSEIVLSFVFLQDRDYETSETARVIESREVHAKDYLVMCFMASASTALMSDHVNAAMPRSGRSFVSTVMRSNRSTLNWVGAV